MAEYSPISAGGIECPGVQSETQVPRTDVAERAFAFTGPKGRYDGGRFCFQTCCKPRSQEAQVVRRLRSSAACGNHRGQLGGPRTLRKDMSILNVLCMERFRNLMRAMIATSVEWRRISMS